MSARFRIDPIDVFHGALGSLFGRLLLFFSAGWVGFLFGRIAAAFYGFEDLLAPVEVFRSVLGDSSPLYEILLTAMWPLTALVSSGDSVPLFFFVLVCVVLFGFVFLFTDTPSPLWWLAAVAVISLIPPVAWEAPRVVSLCVLAFFWLGLGALAWWLLLKRIPKLTESISELISGADGVPDANLTPRRKAPPNAWGRPVEDADPEGSGKDAGAPP